MTMVESGLGSQPKIFLTPMTGTIFSLPSHRALHHRHRASKFGNIPDHREDEITVDPLSRGIQVVAVIMTLAIAMFHYVSFGAVNNY